MIKENKQGKIEIYPFEKLETATIVISKEEFGNLLKDMLEFKLSENKRLCLRK